MLKPIVIITSIALIFYLGACLALFAFQSSFIYMPQRAAIRGTADTMVLTVEGAVLAVSVRRHSGPKALIYLGGNAEDVSTKLPEFSRQFPDHAIYLLQYRGNGASSGQPSEESIHADALALFDKVREQHSNISVLGRSLGSGVAVRLASERSVSRLVLVTPYDSIERIAASQFPYVPVHWLLTDKYESWRYAPSIRVPTLILQAEHDEVIPGGSTARLYAAFAKGIASRIVVRGVGHNDIMGQTQCLDAMQAAL
jgi:uncharacterized protein